MRAPLIERNAGIYNITILIVNNLNYYRPGTL